MNPETKALMQDVAEQAADRAVSEALTRLGVDQTDPFSVQRDMAALRELRALVDDPELQKDLLHLRRWRRTMEAVETKGVMTLVGVVVAGLVAAMWIGVKYAIGKG